MTLLDAQQAGVVSAVAHPSRIAAGSGAIEIAVVEDQAGISRLATVWRALEAATPAPTFFQSFDWCRLVLDLEASRAAPGSRPLILVASEAGRLVGLLPLKRIRGKAASVLTGLGEPFQQYTDLVLAPGADAGSVLAAMLAAPAIQRAADAIELRKVRGDSALFAALGTRVAGLTPIDAAPFVDLRPYADFADYHKTVNAKSRKNMRNQRNRLAREAPLTAASLTSGAEIGRLIRSSYEGRVEWLEREGLSSRAFRDPDFGRFVARFADRGDTGIDVLAVALRHGDASIAEQWGFVHKGRYYAYVASWDPAHEEASPGKLIMEEVLRAAHARGVEVADFLMPAARYKLTWAEAAVPVYDIVLPLTARGRLTAKLWTGWLRPIAKRAVLALPGGVRARLARVVRG
jgi:CelD/BcsL family acetyltransferase involved in cellulose biosynthesis